MEPVRTTGGEGLATRVGVATERAVVPPEGEHATTSARARTDQERLIPEDSDVGPRLDSINSNTRAGDEARLLRADEDHRRRHLIHGAKPAERPLSFDEFGHGFGVCLLAP